MERFEGDLDQHFAKDGLDGVLVRLANGTTRIRVEGNRDRVLGSLRSAVMLYEAFCRAWPAKAPAPRSPSPPTLPVASPARPARPKRTGTAHWPTWEQPTEGDVLALARALTPLVRFLKPSIVRAIVEENERRRAEWSEALSRRGIDADRYLWARGSCAFPGVRRYAGSTEVARHRGRGDATTERPTQALVTDDNAYPKHIWSFVLRGRPFQQFGPPGYELAHLLDHKDYKCRLGDELENGAVLATRVPYGLYTCASNAAYVPRTFLRPTDHAGLVRGLLQRRAQELYGAFCDVAPGLARLRQGPSVEWATASFKWAEAVGNESSVALFLEFRRARVEALLSPKPT